MNRPNSPGFLLIILIATAVFTGLLLQCRHDGLDVSELEKVCYEKDIAPIFQSCSAATGCHSQQSREGGYSFTDYNEVKKAITPFNAQKSKAYKAITGKGFMQLMPPTGALSQKERILIRVWIDQGAENTTCTQGNDGNNGVPLNKVCFQRDLLPVLVSSCGITGCHDQATHEEGYVVANYTTVMNNLVRAGSPSNSKLYTVITKNPSDEEFMPPPPYPPLSAALKDSIFNWIKNGARNEACIAQCDTTGAVTYQNQIATLVSKNCLSCHSGPNASKGVLLDTYAHVKTYLDNGKLLAAVKATSIQMPPGYKISDCELREIELWKINGALQN